MDLQGVVGQGAVVLKCAAAEGLICAALQIYVLLKHAGYAVVGLLDAAADQVDVVVQLCVAVDLAAVDVGQADVWGNVVVLQARDADAAPEDA